MRGTSSAWIRIRISRTSTGARSAADPQEQALYSLHQDQQRGARPTLIPRATPAQKAGDFTQTGRSSSIRRPASHSRTTSFRAAGSIRFRRSCRSIIRTRLRPDAVSGIHRRAGMTTSGWGRRTTIWAPKTSSPAAFTTTTHSTATKIPCRASWRTTLQQRPFDQRHPYLQPALDPHGLQSFQTYRHELPVSPITLQARLAGEARFEHTDKSRDDHRLPDSSRDAH